MSRISVVLAMSGLLATGCDSGTEPDDGGLDSGPSGTDAATDGPRDAEARPDVAASYTLTVVSADGTVTSVPTGIDCGGSCSASFGSAAEIELTAAASSRYRFVDWTEATCRGQGGRAGGGRRSSSGAPRHCPHCEAATAALA